MTDADRKKLLDLADTLQRAGRDLYDTSANAPREVAGPLCAFPVATGSNPVSSAEALLVRWQNEAAKSDQCAEVWGKPGTPAPFHQGFSQGIRHCMEELARHAGLPYPRQPESNK